MNELPTVPQYAVVFVTVPTQADAKAIAQTLIQEKLAACVNLFPIHSIYTWQHEVYQEDEWQLLIKSELAQFQALDDRIRELHSYEIPEIIALPILAGSHPYLAWISTQVKQ